jgi:phosphodiesterase/alkaline phosphatase D-like protein
MNDGMSDGIANEELDMTIMKGFIAGFALLATVAGTAAQLTAGPEVEMSTDSMAIIRWTTANPGGTGLHYGVVRYGTDAANLTQVARSPNRRNQSHADMIFRVRMDGLKSHTTYYYAVESTGATDARDGAASPVGSFKTK